MLERLISYENILKLFIEFKRLKQVIFYKDENVLFDNLPPGVITEFIPKNTKNVSEESIKLLLNKKDDLLFGKGLCEMHNGNI